MTDEQGQGHTSDETGACASWCLACERERAERAASEALPYPLRDLSALCESMLSDSEADDRTTDVEELALAIIAHRSDLLRLLIVHRDVKPDKPMPSDIRRNMVAFARETWVKDSVEGETVHQLCAEVEHANARLVEAEAKMRSDRISSLSHDCGGGPSPCGGCCVCLRAQQRAAGALESGALDLLREVVRNSALRASFYSLTRRIYEILASDKTPAGERDLACASHSPKQGDDHAGPPVEPMTMTKTGPDTNQAAKNTGAEVVPITIAMAGRGIARQALDREDTASALYTFERSIVGLLSDAQAMRRHFDDTGEMKSRVVARSMDTVCSAMVHATGGVDLD